MSYVLFSHYILKLYADFYILFCFVFVDHWINDVIFELFQTLIIGIKGWYPLVSAQNVATISDTSVDPIKNFVGGIELLARFGHHDDRCRVMNSAKILGWIDDNYVNEENFLDGNFNVFKQMTTEKKAKY